MKFRYIGPIPAHNGDLGYVVPGQVYDVPKSRESAFLVSSDFEIVDTKTKTLKKEGE